MNGVPEAQGNEVNCRRPRTVNSQAGVWTKVGLIPKPRFLTATLVPQGATGQDLELRVSPGSKRRPKEGRSRCSCLALQSETNLLRSLSLGPPACLSSEMIEGNALWEAFGAFTTKLHDQHHYHCHEFYDCPPGVTGGQMCPDSQDQMRGQPESQPVTEVPKRREK